MPLNLDHFLNVAANHTTKEIYVAGPTHQPAAQTRGSFKSWVVSIFKGDRTRNQRADTAHAFIAALQEKVSAKASAFAGESQEVKEQFDEHASDIVGGLRKLLANQLNGRSALTANDVHRANEFIDSMLQWADEEKSNLVVSMSREEIIKHLETTAMQFYGRENFEDIHLTDAQAEANKEAVQAAQEQAMAARGIRVVGRAPQAPAPESRAQLLRSYLNGDPQKLSPEKAEEILAKVRSDVREIQSTCKAAIDVFGPLSRGEAVPPNQLANEIEPGSDTAKAYLNAFTVLRDEYLGPLQTLEYFLKADVAEMRRERFLDAKELSLNNGDTITSERSVKEILDEFNAGNQLSEADVAFIDAALNSRAFVDIDRIRPGYALFSGGGSINSAITEVVDSVPLVPNHIWQVITNQAAPDAALLVSNPSEKNPWALAINQQLIARGEDMQDFKNAQRGLSQLLNYIVKSKGDIEVARKMQEEEVAPPKSKHGWKPEARVINEATMKAANEQNEHDKQFSPELFVRGVNRSLNIDENATPARPKPNANKEYTHAYDDDINAGRYEASHPSNPGKVKKPQVDSASGAEGSG